MVLGLVFHIGRVYITGGFLKFREFIWLTGLILVLCTVSFGVTGYSLPWDQLGFWASKIVTSVPEAFDELIEDAGSSLVVLLRGGFSVFQFILTRFYSGHTFVLPLLTVGLLLTYFLLLRKQGIFGFL